MPKILLTFSLFSLLSFSPLQADADFQSRFFDRFNQHQLRDTGEILRAWKKARPADPALPAAFGYYYYSLALKGNPAILTSPAPRESVIATHPFAAEACAFRYGVQLEDTLAQEAQQSWQEALKKDSGRLDLYLNLADLYQDEGDFEDENHILGKALQYSDASDEPMTWMGKGDLPQPQKEFLRQALQSYVDYYFSLGDPDSDEKGYRLAKLLATFYPSDPAGYNSMAAYFSFQGDWEHTLKYLLVASAKAPKDSLVLFNIAAVMEALHHERAARIFWRKVVKLGNDPQWVEKAKEKLGTRRERKKVSTQP